MIGYQVENGNLNCCSNRQKAKSVFDFRLTPKPSL